MTESPFSRYSPSHGYVARILPSVELINTFSNWYYLHSESDLHPFSLFVLQILRKRVFVLHPLYLYLFLGENGCDIFVFFENFS